MSAEAKGTKEMGVIGRIVGIFTSPRETFESIDKKPTWLVPFVIAVVFVIVFQLLTLGIQAKDQIAMLEARDLPAEQIEAAQDRMGGPMQYLGLIFGPVVMLIIWAFLAGVLLFGGNTIMGGDAKYKKVFSVVAWSSLVGLLGGIIQTLLVLSKGTRHGVTTSLAILLPTPEMGQSSALYRLFQRFDLFVIWQLVLWIIGLAVIYRFTTKKSATLVLSLWAIYIVFAVVLGGLFSGFLGG